MSGGQTSLDKLLGFSWTKNTTEVLSYNYCQNKHNLGLISRDLFLHFAFLINTSFIEIEAPSPSHEQDKAVSEHSIPLGKHDKLDVPSFCVTLRTNKQSHTAISVPGYI